GVVADFLEHGVQRRQVPVDVVESGDPQGRSGHLIHDLELHAALLARGAGADDRPQSPRDPSLPADHLAAIVLGDVQPEHEHAVAVDRILLRPDPRQPHLHSQVIYLRVLVRFFFLLAFVALRRGWPAAATGAWPLIIAPRSGIWPRPIPFISFSICLRASSSRLTSSTLVPEPPAIRWRRDPSITVGIARSTG